jgi:hypothetical protein
MRPDDPRARLSLVPEREARDPAREPLVVDVLAVPTDDAMATPYVVADPPAHCISRTDIAAWRKADERARRASRIADYSANPRLCRIVAIGTKVSGQERAVSHLARTVADERIALDEWWHRVEAADGHVVTWHGSWDLHTILLRSIKLRVPITLAPHWVAGWFLRQSCSAHFDVHAALTRWDSPRADEELANWAAFLGLATEKAADSSDIYSMVQRGEWDALGACSRQAVATTDEIYRRIRDYFVPVVGGPGD